MLNKMFRVLVIIFFIFQSATAIELYFVTAADYKYFNHLLNLIGSIHRVNYDNLGEIAVFDLGLTNDQKNYLRKIQKINVYNLEMVRPDLLKQFYTGGRTVPGWYAWKPVCIKQALDKFPYVLWMDSGMMVLKPLNDLFQYIDEKGYFLYNIGDLYKSDGTLMHPVRWSATKFLIETFELNSPENKWILDQEQVDASFIGVSRKAYDSFVKPMYEFAKDFRYFEDDGSTPDGLGTGRHDQVLMSIFVYRQNMHVFKKDYMLNIPITFTINNRNSEFFSTWDGHYVTERAHIYHSRGDQNNRWVNYIRFK